MKVFCGSEYATWPGLEPALSIAGATPSPHVLVQVEGHNLQYCHHVVVRLATAPTAATQAPVSVALPTEVLQVASGPVGHRHHPLSGLQSRLNQVCV